MGYLNINRSVVIVIHNIHFCKKVKPFIKVNKFIKDELEAKKDQTEFGKMSRDATIVRGGQEFSDQFYSQHMRFYKGVNKTCYSYINSELTPLSLGRICNRFN